MLRGVPVSPGVAVARAYRIDEVLARHDPTILDAAALSAEVARFENACAAAGAELSGSVYTQVSDLENELNGLWTYDRREIKVDPKKVREINRQVIAAGAKAGERDELKGVPFERRAAAEALKLYLGD